MSNGKKIKMKWRNGICGVEKFTDGNTKKKRTFYCTDCKIWMCKKCSKDVVKRIMALRNRDLNKKVSII